MHKTGSGRRYRVAVSGSYGGMNLGDEAILQSIVSQLRASTPVEITIFTHDTEHTGRTHDIDRAVGIYSLSRDEARAEIERLDLLVLGGGGILYDDIADGLLREVTLAQQERVPVAVYAVGAGPLNESSKRELVAKVLNQATVITVRDRQARKLLEEVGVEREILLTADPALLLEPAPLPPDSLQREGLDSRNRLVAVSVREPGPAAPDIDVAHYHALLANTADFMIDRFDVDVVFIPMERMQLDVQQSHAVVAKMQYAHRATVLKGDYAPGQLLTLMGHFQFVLGMRLHFLIFAALQGVPFVALPYASKVEGFIEDFDLPMPPLKQVTTGPLIAHVDWSWDMQQELRRRIAGKLPALQERARQTNAIVVQLLRDIEQTRRKEAG